MASHVIELYWPGMTEDLVAEVVDRLENAVRVKGGGLRYGGCTMVTRDEVCFLRVEGGSQAEIEALASELDMVGARVSETLELR